MQSYERTIGKGAFAGFADYSRKHLNQGHAEKVRGAFIREFGALLEGADDRGSKALARHLRTNILPGIAAYRALQSIGLSRDEAFGLLSNYMAFWAGNVAEKGRKIGRIPGFWPIFRLAVGPVMRRDYPNEGWATQWKPRRRDEAAFDISRCLYLDELASRGCRELCPLFCRNDDIIYGSMSLQMAFIRTSTLGRGGACCDFRFVRAGGNAESAKAR
jgi:hypothetical protein